MRGAGDTTLYAQLLFFFSASLNLDGEDKTIERAFVRFLSPEGYDADASTTWNRAKQREVDRIKKLLLPNELVLMYDGATGYGVVDIKSIQTTLHVWPDFHWASNKPRLCHPEAIQQWVLWGWCHDIRGFVVASTRSKYHHFRYLLKS